MRRTIILLLAASLSLSACVGGSGDFEVARTLPEPFGFSKYGPGCYKASTVPTAEPVPGGTGGIGSRRRTASPLCENRRSVRTPRLPRLRKWEIWLALAGGATSLAIGIADLFTGGNWFEVVRSLLLIVGGVAVLLLSYAVARGRQSDGR